MRIRDLLRAAVLSLVLVAAAGAPAHAQVPAGLGPDGRVFALAGGDEPVREGLPAHKLRVRVDERPFAPVALPGREIALVAGRPRQPWLVGMDGRLHALPPLRGLTRLAAAADGTLLAARRERTIHRLAPGAAAWELLLDPRQAVPGWARFSEVEALTALPGGAYAFASPDTGVWRVGPGAGPALVQLGADEHAVALSGRTSGELVVVAEGRSSRVRVLVVPPGGAASALWSSRRPTIGIDARPDGSVLRAGIEIDVLGRAGERRVRIGARPVLGPGDGGPAARAALFAASVSAAPDGAVVAGDYATAGFEHFAGVGPSGRVVESPGVFGRLRTRVRVFAPPGTALPLAAVTRRTYRTLPRGRIAVESTLAGRATVVVRRAGRVVATGEAEVPIGASTIALSATPPKGDLTVALDVSGAEGRAAGARLEVSTFRRLSRRRALSLLAQVREAFNGGEDCARTGPRRFECAFLYRDRVGGRWRPCRGTVGIVQRPDGRRAMIDADPCA